MKQTLVRSLLPLALAVPGASVRAQSFVKVGENLDLHSAGGGQTWQGGVVYNPVEDVFVPCWSENLAAAIIYLRRVSPAGALLGNAIPVQQASQPGFAFDPDGDQYLVAYRSGFEARGRRVRGGDLVPLNEVVISNAYLEHVVLYNSIDREFLHYGRDFLSTSIQAQRIGGDGSLIGAPTLVASGAAFAPAGDGIYNPLSNEYLITYRNQNTGKQFVRRIAADGSAPSPPARIPVFAQSGRASVGVAHDTSRNRYLVVISPQTGGPQAQFVRADGTLAGAPFAVPLPAPGGLGVDVVYVPRQDVYVVVANADARTEVVAIVVRPNGWIGATISLSKSSTAELREPQIAHRPQDDSFLVTWHRSFAFLQGQVFRLEPLPGVFERQPTSR